MILSDGAPRISIAIPLYCSDRFVDCTIANVRAIPGDSVEIIISDRHMADDAVPRLRQALIHDTRVRFVTGHDGPDWVTHFNDLLKQARGTYFMWMPHDDEYPAEYLPLLMEQLTRNPTAILAFGRIAPIGHDGTPRQDLRFPDPPIEPGEPWSSDVVARLLERWELGVPFRGLMRRDKILESNLFIRSTRNNYYADGLWVMAVALHGRLVYDPSCHVRKRFYAGSAHARWPKGIPQALSLLLTLWHYTGAAGLGLTSRCRLASSLTRLLGRKVIAAMRRRTAAP